MTFFTKEQLKNKEHLYKINLINSLSGYKSANLIGSISKEGVENVAVFSSVTHLGSNPPLFGFILRPTTVPRNTYKNIKETEIYTINHIHQGIISEAHHTSAKYPEDISEFEMTKLESEFKDNFKAPFVKKSPIQIAMKYVEEYTIKANGVLLIVGEIQSVHIDDNLLEDDGFVNLSTGKVATINGLDAYSVPESNKRESYQRPKK